MSDNNNNVHFAVIRFICSPYLAIKLTIASLGPIIMTRYGLQMNVTDSRALLRQLITAGMSEVCGSEAGISKIGLI